MNVQSVNSAAAAPHKPAAPASDGGLGKQSFLQLLLTQLRQQDPLKPMDDKEFIVQLAQFTTLEQMQQMQQTMTDVLALQKLDQATSLIGRTVAGQIAGGQAFSDKVTGVKLTSAGPVLVTPSGSVALSDVQNVT